MSAREELHESLCGSCCGRSALGECAAVNLQIDAFAHELAEKIRQEHASQWDLGNPDWDAREAADLIDPEVQT